MVSIRWCCLILFVENKSYIDGFVLAISKVAEIKFLTEEVDPKIEDDSIGGEGGGGGRRGREISESRLVHILHNNIRICVVPQIQRRLRPFANVIFQSQNFILTSCSTSPTWFLIKKKTFLQTLTTNFIHHISSINRPGAWSKFQLKGAVLIERRALYQGIYITRKLLVCTDYALVQAL